VTQGSPSSSDKANPNPRTAFDDNRLEASGRPIVKNKLSSSLISLTPQGQASVTLVPLRSTAADTPHQGIPTFTRTLVFLQKYAGSASRGQLHERKRQIRGEPKCEQIHFRHQSNAAGFHTGEVG